MVSVSEIAFDVRQPVADAGVLVCKVDIEFHDWR
jgi:hypothetical protein